MKKIIATAALAVMLSSGVYAGGITTEPAQVPANWTGFYVGVNAGYTWTNATTTFTPLPSAAVFGVNPLTLSETQSGAVVGGQIGYDWQLPTYPRFLIGILADIDHSDIDGGGLANGVASGSTPLPLNGMNYFSDFHQNTWFGTVRPRIGFLLGNNANWLIYGTGGLAYGREQQQGNANVGLLTMTSSTYPATKYMVKVGWVAGAGTEWKFAPHWSTKAEYLYYNLGNISATGNPIPANPPLAMNYTWKMPVQVVTLGINYHFSS